MNPLNGKRMRISLETQQHLCPNHLGRRICSEPSIPLELGVTVLIAADLKQTSGRANTFVDKYMLHFMLTDIDLVGSRSYVVGR